MNTPAAPQHPADHDEPEITREEAVPLDGKDVEGEKMMKEVTNDKLAEKPGEEKDADD